MNEVITDLILEIIITRISVELNVENNKLSYLN